MTKQAEFIKEALTFTLQEQGKTLQDFEQELQKVAGGSMLSIPVDMFTNLGKILFNTTGGTAMLVGGLGGLGAYAGIRANRDSTMQHLKHQQEKQQYLDAAKELQENLQNSAPHLGQSL